MKADLTSRAATPQAADSLRAPAPRFAGQGLLPPVLLESTAPAEPFAIGSQLIPDILSSQVQKAQPMSHVQIAIVTPVLNDWESFRDLVRSLRLVEALQPCTVTVVAVDDGSISIDAPQSEQIDGCISQIRIVRLKANLGHQRAIALGLAYINANLSPDHVIVMDSDGEDRPDAINLLLAEAHQHPGAIIVAQRAKRSEGIVFRAGYLLYKQAFRYLTGKPISFGNFSLIPGDRIEQILYNSGIWNNFAATLLKSRLPLRFVPTERGTRYHGESKMNYTSLMIHGFSAISVFTDVVIGRIITLLALATIAAGIAITWIVIAKLSGSFVPGYATTVILLVVSMLLLCLFGGFLLILSLLAQRESASALPANLLAHFVRDVTILRPAALKAIVAP